MFVNLVVPMNVSELYHIRNRQSCTLEGWYVFNYIIFAIAFQERECKILTINVNSNLKTLKSKIKAILW